MPIFTDTQAKEALNRLYEYEDAARSFSRDFDGNIKKGKRFLMNLADSVYSEWNALESWYKSMRAHSPDVNALYMQAEGVKETALNKIADVYDTYIKNPPSDDEWDDAMSEE